MYLRLKSTRFERWGLAYGRIAPALSWRYNTSISVIRIFLPVRLLWTKAAYDYMYASGETLLRNFPVQATIQVVDWSSDEEEEEEDDDNWEHNEEESATSCEQESKKSSSQAETKERNFHEI